MEKTLFVHIGVQKSGTTAIQTHFTIWRHLLSLMGVHYPRLGASIFRNQDIVEDIKSPNASFATLGNYREVIIQSKKSKHLLSAESLFALPKAPNYFSRFNDISRVVAVIFLRRQDRFLESLYRQLIKNKATALQSTFHDFCDFRLKEKTTRIKISWMKHLLDWENEIGRENIIVIPYSDHGQFNSIAKMAEILEVPFIAKLPQTRSGDNLSLSCEMIEILRYYNTRGIILDRKKLSKVSRQIRYRTTAYFDMEQREKIIAKYAPINHEIGERYGVDMSPLCSLNKEIEHKRLVFDLDLFQLSEMKDLVRSLGMSLE